MIYHVAFLRKDPLTRVLTGVKRAECRLSKARHPARTAQTGDTLLFKAVGGPIVAGATITDVHVFANLRPQDISALAELVAPMTGAPATSAYWETKHAARHAVVILFGPVWPAELPAMHTPAGVFSGWVSNHPAVELTRGPIA